MLKIKSDKFRKLIYDINKGNDIEIPWQELNEKEMQAKFIGGLIKGKEQIEELFEGELGKRGGFSGSGLPLTIKILNKNDDSPALQPYTGFEKRWLVVYFGISPELENFISIVMWPSQSESSRNTFEKIRNLIQEKQKILEFEGSYQIYPPNEVHPQQVKKLNIAESEESFYDWPYFPFIKDVGDSLKKPLSAINYKRVLLRNSKEDIYEDYINVRVTVGSIVEIRDTEIKVKLPFFNRISHPYTFKIRHNLKDKELKINNLYSFLLIERAGELYPEVYNLKEIYKTDALAHTLSYELYRRFISSAEGNEYRKYLINKVNNGKTGDIGNIFSICTLDELKNIFNEHKEVIYRKAYYDVNSYENLKINLFDYIFNVYLSAYFEINKKNNCICYKPPIFRHEVDDFKCEKILKMNKIIRHYTYNINLNNNLKLLKSEPLETDKIFDSTSEKNNESILNTNKSLNSFYNVYEINSSKSKNDHNSKTNSKSQEAQLTHIKALDDKNWFKRRSAAKNLGNIGDKTAISHLIKALNDENTFVKLNAIESLGKIGDQTVIEHLILVSEDDNPNISDKALESIENIRNRLGIEEISEKEAKSTQNDEEIYPKVSESLNTQIKALRHKDWFTRKNAVKNLGDIADKRIIPYLIKTLKDDDRYVKMSVIEVLGKIGDQAVIDSLIQAAEDGDSKIKEKVLDAIQMIEYRLELDNTNEHVSTKKKQIESNNKSNGLSIFENNKKDSNSDEFTLKFNGIIKTNSAVTGLKMLEKHIDLSSSFSIKMLEELNIYNSNLQKSLKDLQDLGFLKYEEKTGKFILNETESLHNFCKENQINLFNSKIDENNINMDSKVCKDCKKSLPLSEFYDPKSKKYIEICKECLMKNNAANGLRKIIKVIQPGIPFSKETLKKKIHKSDSIILSYLNDLKELELLDYNKLTDKYTLIPTSKLKDFCIANNIQFNSEENIDSKDENLDNLQIKLTEMSNEIESNLILKLINTVKKSDIITLLKDIEDKILNSKLLEVSINPLNNTEEKYTDYIVQIKVKVNSNDLLIILDNLKSLNPSIKENMEISQVVKLEI